ncbi:MAG: rhomboid family intramembrane serine protease [Acidobacteriaceae bacterium]|nr:rhomboid family intramembrane serine protease [Acidobacteriaceae bacterium]
MLTLIPFFFIYFTWLPAWLVLGYWFVVQFLSGAATSIAAQQASGVAFWAHVGGFVAGLAMIKIFPRRTPRYRFDTWQ